MAVLEVELGTGEAFAHDLRCYANGGFWASVLE